MAKKIDDLQKYWEIKLNISYKVEYEYYKKLCGYKYNPKIIGEKYDANSEYVSYKNWKKNIKKQIKDLDIQQLKEYSKYLESERRENDTIYNLSQTLLVPFMFYVIGTLFDLVVIPLINRNEESYAFLLNILWLVPFFIYFFYKLLSTKEESVRKYFYQDMKEIVDKRIEKMKSDQT